VFCICRKGDNHTWMIACDGGCDEWFHGNCVDIKERDGELIDKYICPTCTRPNLLTTWKRMCRRRDCRKPARVTQVPPSKYCSDACGRMFFVELVQRGDDNAQSNKNGEYLIELPKHKKRREKHTTGKKEKLSKPPPNLVNGVDPDSRMATPAYSDEERTEYETDSSLDDDDLPNRGAALRAGEVKALVDRCKTIDDWKALGRKPDTPPRDLDNDVEMGNANDTKPPAVEEPLEYDAFSLQKLQTLSIQKAALTARSAILAAREKFLDLIKTRSQSITDEVKKSAPKQKDICGFDPRIGWSDEEFSIWYHERGGKDIIDAGDNAKIGPPEDDTPERNPNTMTNGSDGHPTPSGVTPSEEDEEETDSMPKKGGVCIKNRCPRHKNWAKGQLAEVRFEQDLVRRAMLKLGGEEAAVRELGVVGGWERRG
jgi:COMPASS component SPP1